MVAGRQHLRNKFQPPQCHKYYDLVRVLDDRLLCRVLRRPDLAAAVWHLKQPQAAAGAEIAKSLKARAILTLAYRCGLRAGEVLSDRKLKPLPSDPFRHQDSAIAPGSAGGAGSLESVLKLDQALQSFRSMRRMEASFKNARSSNRRAASRASLDGQSRSPARRLGAKRPDNFSIKSASAPTQRPS